MKPLVKPGRLKPGDKVAAVSLSWGGAGEPEIRWRYDQGKARLEERFGLQVVEMPHTLAPADFVYRHPEARAADFMAAFSDPEIKGIFSCIGGNDSIRMLPYVDYDVIHQNPKVFLGYSDTTVGHFICFKAGVSSFYGPAILSDFAEDIALPEYTEAAVRRALFSPEVIGPVTTSNTYTGQRLEWEIKNKDTARKFRPNTGYELLQGRGRAEGRLIGGCLEVLEYIKGTELFPDIEEFDGAILFLETSEVASPPWLVEDNLRWMGTVGILGRLKGILWGKPIEGRHYEAYKTSILKVMAEFGREEMPILYNASFGHNEPKTVLPYGGLACIDSAHGEFSILEPGVE